MDAVKYFKIKKRMTNGCTENSNCSQCVLDSDNNPYGVDCVVFEMQHPEEAVAAVEKWAEEHPVKTRMDKFLEIYPNANVERNRRTKAFLRICPISIDTTKRETHNCSQYDTCNDCLSEYWNEEVEE